MTTTPNLAIVKHHELRGEFALWGKPTGMFGFLPKGEYVKEDSTYFVSLGGEKSEKNSWLNVTHK